MITAPKQEFGYIQPMFGSAAPGDAGGSAALGIVAGGLAGALVGVITAPTTGPVRRWTLTPAGDAVLEPAQVPAR